MHRRVGRYAALAPIRCRALVVVALERIAVRRIVVVTEQGAEAFFAAPADQELPVVMPDLVAKVADQGPMCLLHIDTPALAFGVVGLVEIDRNAAAGMAGENALDRAHRMPGLAFAHQLGLEVEFQRRVEAVVGGAVGQPRDLEAIEQAPLGRLDPGPLLAITRDRGVGDGVVVAAAVAKRGVARRRRHDHPVAHAGPAIVPARDQRGAAALGAAVPESVCTAVDATHGATDRAPARGAATVQALRVVEEEALPTGAVEGPHACSQPPVRTRAILSQIPSLRPGGSIPGRYWRRRRFRRSRRGAPACAGAHGTVRP